MRVALKASAFCTGVLMLAMSPMGMSPMAMAAGCPNPNALGVSRTVEIDTTGGPGFGFEHYKAYDFLQAKEVVLTFDDGPQKFSTEMVLAALAEQCTKAIFFSIGKMALGYPEIIREVAKAGHTIGTHTWSHQPIAKLKSFEEGKDEIERGNSSVKRATGGPISPFFRFPTLVSTPEAEAYLGTRNIAMWSTDIDSFDFKPQPAEHIVKSVMAKLEKRGKGIVLMHDIHKTTAKALPLLLAELKAKGYKIVHVKAKGEMKTLAEYDSAIEKDAKGLPSVGAERPTTSIVRTIEGTPAPEETVKPAAAEPAKAEPAKAMPPPPAAAPTPKAEAPTPAPAPKAEAPADTQAASRQSVAATAPVSPVTTVPAATSPATTASIKNAGDDDRQPVSSNSGGAQAVAAQTPAGPQKSISERAKEIWELWFGK